jgi:hypothetical protein
MMRSILRRGSAWAAGAGIVVALGACDDLLRVENPGAIDETDVTEPVFAPQMVSAAINEFQTRYAYLAYAGAIFTDEALNGHNFSQWRDIDLRLIEDDNSMLVSTTTTGAAAGIYNGMQTSRAVGDDMVERLRQVVDNPASSIQLATALAYTGYSYTRLGEYFCYAPMDGNSAAIRSPAILDLGIDRFDEAIQIGQAAGGADGQRIVNLARVGAARASLQLGNMQDAVSYASQVEPGFEAFVRHVSSPTGQRNYFWGETTGTNRTIGVGPAFVGLNDARVRHTANWVTGHNQQTQLYTPAQSPAFADWDAVPMDIGDGELIDRIGIDQDTDMVLASHLEARYIIAEAGGMSDADLREFINERRAVGGQGEFTGTDLQAELRDQRRRDFFLSGHRVGDLRRYLDLYGVNYWPTGEHPNNAEWGWGNYQDATCFIPHLNEGVSNPNYEPLD